MPATGRSNHMAGVGNYMTATQAVSTVCGDAANRHGMHEMS